jgi:hypothetical protein
VGLVHDVAPEPVGAAVAQDRVAAPEREPEVGALDPDVALPLELEVAEMARGDVRSPVLVVEVMARDEVQSTELAAGARDLGAARRS